MDNRDEELPDLMQGDHDWINAEAFRLFRKNEIARGVQRPDIRIPPEYLDYWIAVATWSYARKTLEENAFYRAEAPK